MNINEYPTNFKWDGFYRAQVIDSKDPLKQGRCKVWIPSLMPEISVDTGIWARSANNPIGGRNSDSNSFYQGTCYIPVVGSYVFVFFEQGDPSTPFYFGSCDIGTSSTPIENQQGSNYNEKWTVIKTKQGRVIITSDDPSDERTEITGKKRSLGGSNPAGNESSVYEINGNQSVILIDDRSGKEKILIKDFNGNYINIDTSKNEIDIESTGVLQVKAAKELKLYSVSDLHIKSDKDIFIEANSVNIKSATEIKASSNKISCKANQDIILDSTTSSSIKSGGVVSIDGSSIAMQQGSSQSGSEAPSAQSANPVGNRVDPSTTKPLELTTSEDDSDEVPKTYIDNSLPPTKTD